jgi:Domain of unknown function (DUF4920)
MPMTRSAVLALAVLFSSSAALAHDSAPAKPATAPAVKAATMEKGKVLARGEKLKGLPAVTLADLTGTPEKYQDKSVRLEGTVRRACDKMGCWMELAESADKSAAGVRVLMKDHAFFVPTDSAGCKATVEGTVNVKAPDQAEVDHMKSEGGAVPTGKDGKAREVQVEAVGVELVRS